MVGQPTRDERPIEPPFFRGDGEPTGVCDFLLPSGDACDMAGRYAIWWIPVPEMDLDTRPVSTACLEHGLTVDRALVERMHSLGVVREAGHVG